MLNSEELRRSSLTKDWQHAVMFMTLVLPNRAKLGHGLLSGQYAKPPVKSELIEQVMKEEYKVLNWVCRAPYWVHMFILLINMSHYTI